MADPKAPSFDYCLGQLCQDLGMLPKDLGSLLSAHGLHIVSEAEKRVLEACAAMTIVMPSCQPRPPAKMGPIPKAGVMAVVEAELARRSGT